MGIGVLVAVWYCSGLLVLELKFDFELRLQLSAHIPACFSSPISQFPFHLQPIIIDN